MAGDNEALGNSVIVTGVKTAFVNANNTAADASCAGHVLVQATYSNSPVDVEPERFRDMGTTAASITFKQLNGEAAETWNIVCEYEISKSP